FGGFPFIGADVVEWIRGNYAVADCTLTRSFMLHVFLLPIAVILLVLLSFLPSGIPPVNIQVVEEIFFELDQKKFIKGKKTVS
ncbi:cytochrome b N-terminal domain-containing protein, partial [Helicobacter pylori]|uniref:cytochrome b N-terminal domain-containing protein n=1 Tax=Helicobacter pylori TaxID=210 RepID=UPI0009D042A2